MYTKETIYYILSEEGVVTCSNSLHLQLLHVPDVLLNE